MIELGARSSVPEAPEHREWWRDWKLVAVGVVIAVLFVTPRLLAMDGASDARIGVNVLRLSCAGRLASDVPVTVARARVVALESLRAVVTPELACRASRVPISAMDGPGEFRTTESELWSRNPSGSYDAICAQSGLGPGGALVLKWQRAVGVRAEGAPPIARGVCKHGPVERPGPAPEAPMLAQEVPTSADELLAQVRGANGRAAPTQKEVVAYVWQLYRTRVPGMETRRAVLDLLSRLEGVTVWVGEDLSGGEGVMVTLGWADVNYGLFFDGTVGDLRVYSEVWTTDGPDHKAGDLQVCEYFSSRRKTREPVSE